MIDVLKETFLDTLSPIPEDRSEGHYVLSKAARHPDFVPSVLLIIADPSVDEPIRKAAAVILIDHVKSCWVVPPSFPVFTDEDHQASLNPPLLGPEKELIKSQIVSLMLDSGPNIQPLIIEAILEICSIYGVLSSINALFDKFKDEELRIEYCPDIFAHPLSSVFQRIAGLLLDLSADPTVLSYYIDSQTLCCLDLDYKNNELVSALDELRAAVCENISLFIEKDDETFINDYLIGFVDTIWGLLLAASPSSCREEVTIKFLTWVSSSPRHDLFASDHILQQVVQGILEPLALLPVLLLFLDLESILLRSYAATCIEKFMLAKYDVRLWYSTDMLAEKVPRKLVSALELEPEGNEYVMKCILRVLGVVEVSPDVALSCLYYLIELVDMVCRNQAIKSQVFCQYMFESVAALVRQASERDPSIFSALEAVLFPRMQFQVFVHENIGEFLPYALQLLVRLVELIRKPMPTEYVEIFEELLTCNLLGVSNYVVPLVYLLQTFLRNLPHDVLVQQGKLKNVLYKCSELLSTSSSPDQGLFARDEDVKFLNKLVIFMSLFVVSYGVDKLVASINAVKNGLFLRFLEKVWIPNLEMVTGFIKMKLTSVATTKLICESPNNIWESGHAGKLLNNLVSRFEERAVADELEVLDVVDWKREEDHLDEIKDTKQFMVVSLSKLCASSPGKYTDFIANSLDQASQAALSRVRATYDVSLV
ncbi:OLC1v1000636C1 [Oldenlandia corymbosa var. corymbosa]|uniref:OLC1v1000636C1 n=1 Tax=Oldenlandia corymbosa var. corymbosa TaxID=529605 RepID=A0AAV1D3B4_OLDCO|nr:OLC1v1000636C1 [Oldenlandia corymbosa var. corymbosa]